MTTTMANCIVKGGRGIKTLVLRQRPPTLALVWAHWHMLICEKSLIWRTFTAAGTSLFSPSLPVFGYPGALLNGHGPTKLD